MSAALADTGTVEQQEAAATVSGIMQTLADGSSRHSAIKGSFLTNLVARTAIGRVGECFPETRFTVAGSSRERIECSLEEVVDALVAVLTNAAEAQEGRGESICVRLVEEREKAVIEVVDRGPGIAGRARARLFEPFHTTKDGHYGLGLYFARMLVESNNGTLCLLPHEEGGTVARLCFPSTS
jgi:signal transduction histidine kinase